ncbi:DUF1796 family putative cysteine peptidase [Lysobacter sp. A286]
MYAKVISIGATCQTAKQIRNQLGQNEAYYFDWLISPLPAVIKAIENDFEEILLPENLTYSDDRKIRLIDSANGLQYQHDFPIDRLNPDLSQREVILPSFAEHADLVREKYRRRAERTREVLKSGERVLLVRYAQVAEDLTEVRRQDLCNTFKRAFPSGELFFLWASPLVNEFKSVEAGWMCSLPQVENWDGDALGWRKVFECCGAIPTSGG